MNDLLDRAKSVTVVSSLGEALEERQIYDLIAANVTSRQIEGRQQLLTLAWLSKRSNGELVPVAFTGEMPQGRHYIVLNGTARRTDPPR